MAAKLKLLKVKKYYKNFAKSFLQVILAHNCKPIIINQFKF